MEQKSYVTGVNRKGKRFSIVVHPCEDAEAIIINCPGFRGSIDGYNNKYITLADFLVQQEVGAVVRMPNVERAPEQYKKGLLSDLRAVIEHALVFAHEMTEVPNPEIYLMGFSAGGYAVASVAAEYPEVKKILLMEPSASGRLLGEFPREKLSQYRGEVYIVIGDTGVGYQVAELYQKAFSKAARVELHVIQNCDHQFKGEKNGKILSKAPLWAFAGDPTFPSPDGGIELY